MDERIPAAAMPGGKETPDKATVPEAASHAARGDDDLMSQPQPPALSQGPRGNGWKSQIGRARRTWSKLAGADLARIDGDMARLAGLLRSHYDFSDAEIDRQIAGFLDGEA
jgi:hypothetical protein